MICLRARWVMKRVFSEPEPRTPLSRAFFDHLGGCDSCRRLYDRAITAERLLEGTAADEPSDRELQRLEAATLPTVQQTRPWHSRWALPLAAAGAAAVASIVVSLVPSGPVPDGEWQARSGAQPTLAVRAFCLDVAHPTEESVRPLSAEPSADEVSACSRSDVVMFAYQSRLEGLLHARARTQGKVSRCLAAGTEAIPVSVSDRLRRLPLQLHWESGDGELLRVDFLLSKTPLSCAQLEEVLSGEENDTTTITVPFSDTRGGD